MFRYYQMGEKGTWTLAKVEEHETMWDFCRRHKAVRVSAIALSHDPDVSGADLIHYVGPWYADIDNKDLGKALEAGVELCDKLINIGVDKSDLEVHLSGAKGIHVFLHPKVFSSGKLEKNLADVYKKMALDLFVPGMDMQVYSKGKGRLFRPPDARRPDGNYKVMSSYAELQELSVEDYKDLTSGPRGLLEFNGPCKKSTILSSMFSSNRNKKLDIPDKASVDDMAVFGGEAPPCIKDLAEGKRSLNTSFNQISLNVACWSARADLQPVMLESLHSRIAENCPSSKGVSAYRRRSELQAMHGFIKSDTDKYKFNCGSILKTVSTRPCADCSLRTEQVLPGSIPDSHFMYARNGQWYSDQDCTRIAATFTMDRDFVLVDEESRNKKAESSVVTLTIMPRGDTYTIHDFSEEAWTSKAAFKKEVMGIDGAAFLGSDNDVQRMRMTLAKFELLTMAYSEVRTIFKSNKAGIIYRRRSGPESVMEEDHVGRLVYCEPGFTVNDAGIFDTHKLVGENTITPTLKLRDNEDTPLSSKACEALRLLFECNTPAVMSTMIGWYLLAHIKQHVYQVEKRGILLCVSGVAGTGKNSLVGVMQRLAGLEGEKALYTLEAPQSTKLPFQQALSNSTTIPRIINEMNPKSVSTRHYRDLIELIKGAFDSQHIAKGRLGGGDKSGANVSSVSWKITAPVLTLSEEIINEPAVVQRAIRVDLIDAGREKGSVAFRQLEPRADDLVDLARVLVHGALQTPVQKIGEMFKATELPKSMATSDIPDRLRFGYKTIIMAYDWALELLSNPSVGMDSETLKQLGEMKAHFIDHIVDTASDIAKRSSITEVDKVLKDLAVMAYHSGDARYPWALEKARHFVLDQGVLYLDMPIVYPQLQRYKQTSTDPLGIRNEDAFMSAVKGMKYFISNTALTDYLPTQGRPVLALNAELLQEKGIHVSMFT